MIGQAEAWRMGADTWTALTGAMGDDHWDKPSTCDEWTVRELVDHTLYWQGMAGRLLSAGTQKGDDWNTLHTAISAALDDPTCLEGNDERFSDMPRHRVFGLMLADLLIHSWDLATSIGAEIALPEEAAEAAMFGLQRMPVEMLRSPNMFGPEVEVAADASAQNKLIGFVGRQP